MTPNHEYRRHRPQVDEKVAGDEKIGHSHRHGNRHYAHLSPQAHTGLASDNTESFTSPTKASGTLSPLGGWVAWLASVLATSLVISYIFSSGLRLDFWPRFGRQAPSLWHPEVADMPSVSPAPRSAPAPLGPRDTCSSGGDANAEFGMPLRIGAVFIILGVSGLACGFPSLAKRFPGMNMPSGFFFAVRHFGTGVLIATSFCHLLPTAFGLLGDPCLSSFWNESYTAMPGAISLAAILFITVIEMLLHPAHVRSEPELKSGPKPSQPPRSKFQFKGNLRGRSRSIGRGLSNAAVTNNSAREQLQDGHDKAKGKEHSEEGMGAVLDPTSAPFDERMAPESPEAGTSRVALSAEQKLKKDMMNCFLLEMGILFHSVFIGMALSVSIGGSEFVILLIAITFHQTFEGLALGARIADIEWPEGSYRPLFMVVAYGCTTPLGQAIGLAAHSAYRPDSEIGLVLVGVMNAFSSGLLIFASLIELLSEDLLTDESWVVLHGRRRIYAFLLIVAGAFGMALVGAWA